MLETAQWLSSRVSLLDPVQLETADVRVSALSQKLDQIAEKTANITSSQDPDRDKKVFAMCNFNVENLINLRTSTSLTYIGMLNI